MSTENLQLRAGEVMDVLVRVAPQTPLRTVIRRILVSGAAAAAVVDDRGQLSGLITSHELARGDDAAEMLTASQLMSEAVVTTTEHELWVDVTRRLCSLEVNYAVVMREGVPVGCFSCPRRDPAGFAMRSTTPETPAPLGSATPGRRRRRRIVGIEESVGNPVVENRLVNLTGRQIVVCTPDGEALLALMPSDCVVRTQRQLTPVGVADTDGVSVPVYLELVSTEPQLPAPRLGTSYVVDRDVALACADRVDLLFPNGGLVDEVTGTWRVASLAGFR